eukprot:11741604-Alexandrium_andersonii.AAC.1
MKQDSWAGTPARLPIPLAQAQRPAQASRGCITPQQAKRPSQKLGIGESRGPRASVPGLRAVPPEAHACVIGSSTVVASLARCACWDRGVLGLDSGPRAKCEERIRPT